jgi:hypothetical protein
VRAATCLRVGDVFVLAQAHACALTTRMHATEFLRGPRVFKGKYFCSARMFEGFFFFWLAECFEGLVFLLSIVFTVTYFCWPAARARRQHTCMHLQAKKKGVVACKNKNAGNFVLRAHD